MFEQCPIRRTRPRAFRPGNGMPRNKITWHLAKDLLGRIDHIRLGAPGIGVDDIVSPNRLEGRKNSGDGAHGCRYHHPVGTLNSIHRIGIKPVNDSQLPGGFQISPMRVNPDHLPHKALLPQGQRQRSADQPDANQAQAFNHADRTRSSAARNVWFSSSVPTVTRR